MSDPFTILEYICMIEESTAVLYKAYARRFLEYAAFWEDLAGEELQHAELVTQLLLEYERNVLQIHESHKDEQQYHALIHVLSEQVHAVKTSPISMTQALTFARQLEQSFVEQHLSQVFTTEHDEMQFVLDKLTEDSARHLRLLEMMCDDFIHNR